MKRLLIMAAALSMAAGCTSRADRARTAADVWHIGKALEEGHSVLRPDDLTRMGLTLQQIGDRWAEDLGIPFDKSPAKENPNE